MDESPGLGGMGIFVRGIEEEGRGTWRVGAREGGRERRGDRYYTIDITP
jgi:hypothetical protein